MAKGTTVRQRDKKKSHSTSKNFTDSTVGSAISPNNENLHNQNLWRSCVFAILLSVGSVSLFCLKDTELFSRTWRSIQTSHAFHSSTDQNKEELPCNFGDNFTVDRRSDLSLEEFSRCYDAKRYLMWGQCKIEHDFACCNCLSVRLFVCLFVCFLAGGLVEDGKRNWESLQDPTIHGGVWCVLDVIPPVDHNHGHVGREGYVCILPCEEGAFPFWSQNL